MTSQWCSIHETWGCQLPHPKGIDLTHIMPSHFKAPEEGTPDTLGCFFCAPPGTPITTEERDLPQRKVLGEFLAKGADSTMVYYLACGHEVI